MTSNATPSGDLVFAAGCLVYRHDDDGIAILVVHRPRYDDWSFPKGKREPGEDDLSCAIREVEEETGCVGQIGPELAREQYMFKGRNKQVRWWLLRYTDGRFEENEEVDEVRWLPVEEARALLSHEHSRHLLDSLDGFLGPNGS